MDDPACFAQHGWTCHYLVCPPCASYSMYLAFLFCPSIVPIFGEFNIMALALRQGASLYLQKISTWISLCTLCRLIFAEIFCHCSLFQHIIGLVYLMIYSVVKQLINPLPDDKILGLHKLKASADNKSNVTQKC